MDQLKPSPANSSPLTPLGFLERAATVYGDCPSVVYNTTTYTWSLHARSSSKPSLSSRRISSLHFSSSSPMIRSHHHQTPFVSTTLTKVWSRKFEWVRPENEWDPMILNYTSGTTSAPKGVVHTHRGTFFTILDGLLDWSVPKQPVYLWTLAMFHVNGWGFSWGMAAVGGTNICLRKFDAPIIYRLIEKHNVTHMCGAPVVLNMLTNYSNNLKPLKSPVESVLYTHPAVNEAAVVARPDEYWGETPCAFLSLKELTQKPSEKEIIEFCRAKLPHYMVPKTVVFKDELPKTSTGKIRKFELRQIAKAMGAPTISRI
ncbi:putative acyl-activating enzyme 5 [Quercus suber]|uniref:Acyl-activating enzyme 5 n=1 Tax=Quercus suber TaxID=58331 RepID=A0AAW0KPJ1_QUESU